MERILSYIILYYLNFCSVKMSADSLNELLEKLESVNMYVLFHHVCLLMFGVDEKYRNNENTDDLVVAVINNEFGINITVNNIERSHRLEAINNRRNLRSARINPLQLSSDLILFLTDKRFLKPNDLQKVNKFLFRRTSATMTFTRRR